MVAVDCTQDEAILAAGRARELINHIQQLRKNAGLEIKDKVEAFFEESDVTPLTENAVSSNVALFKAKFKGSVPLPKRFAPKWSVVVGSDEVEIAGAKVTVSICRVAAAAKDDLGEMETSFVSTIDPENVEPGATLSVNIDGKESTLKEGEDFWTTTVAKLEATGAVGWLSPN